MHYTTKKSQDASGKESLHDCRASEREIRSPAEALMPLVRSRWISVPCDKYTGKYWAYSGVNLVGASVVGAKAILSRDFQSTIEVAT